MGDKLFCPKCGWWIMNKNKKVRAEVTPITAAEPNADFSVKCQRCKIEVAVKKRQ